ncbi:MAG: ATP-binding protein, partial [Candidatus Marinimicrobia bacterium]|nr:ATP-binding protein [Candidatus Neomarinimicrobiota bacterium]
MQGLRAKTIITVLFIILVMSLTYISFFARHGADLADILGLHRNDLIVLVFITLMVLILTTLILYRAFSKLYGKMVVLNRELNQKNEELQKAARRLEDDVATRTAELAEANTLLHGEIEQRHEAYQSLARSLEEWQNTFDAIADPVTILDKDLKITSANRAAQKLLSLGGDNEIIGRTCYELFAGATSRCSSCPAEDVFTKGIQQDYEIEHEYLGKHLMASCAPIFVGGTIIGYVHTAKDVTREKTLKKQLAQAQKMEAIATLAGGIAHDFNNILGAILGNADLMLFRLSGNKSTGKQSKPELNLEDVEDHVQAIKKAGYRAKELVSQILAFSRQGKTQRQNAVITPVIKEAVKLLRSSLPANIDIAVDLAPDLCHIFADLTQIHQVFMNLCTNAAQAMDEKGGTLTLSVKVIKAGPDECRKYKDLKPGRYIALAVEDTGHGMTPGIMERMFDPFFTTRDVGEGTGMGLAVIHGIITFHDGILDVKSTVDKGSVFTALFPCVNVNDSGGEDVILGIPRGNEKLLFVDDEEDIVRMTSRMLEYLGYTVYSAQSADEALTMLKSDTFEVDLVITDYSMPGISGIDLAEEISMIQPGLPVMLC